MNGYAGKTFDYFEVFSPQCHDFLGFLSLLDGLPIGGSVRRISREKRGVRDVINWQACIRAWWTSCVGWGSQEAPPRPTLSLHMVCSSARFAWPLIVV